MKQELSWVKINDEYYDLVPRPSKQDYNTLKNSIKDDGLQIPITINADGVILDGHTRYQICQELKIKPKFVIKKFDNLDKEKEFVVTTNLARRHLTLFQRGEAVFGFYDKERATRYQRAGISTWKVRHGEQEKKDPADHSERLLTRFGRMIGAGPSIAHMLTWLIEHADETLKEQLRKDEIKIQTAYRKLRQIKLRPTSEYGYLFRYTECLNCGGKLALPKDTNCHVHTQHCCTKCGWGN